MSVWHLYIYSYRSVLRNTSLRGKWSDFNFYRAHTLLVNVLLKGACSKFDGISTRVDELHTQVHDWVNQNI